MVDLFRFLFYKSFIYLLFSFLSQFFVRCYNPKLFMIVLFKKVTIEVYTTKFKYRYDTCIETRHKNTIFYSDVNICIYILLNTYLLHGLAVYLYNFENLNSLSLA